MAYKGDPEKDLMVDYLDHKTMSFKTLVDAVKNFEHNCYLNNIDPCNVPFIVKTENFKFAIPWYGLAFGIGTGGATVSVEYYKQDKCMPIVPDVRPEGEGEYWSSRGAGVPDIAGFVTSKQAGVRINMMVDRVLETYEHKSYLDYRETEPTWIQYKFHEDEFDMEKLDTMTRENNGVITEDIIKQCKKEERNF